MTSSLPRKCSTNWATQALRFFWAGRFSKGIAQKYFSFWAGDGTRTRDQQLGRLWLYQLSYSRMHSIPSYVKNLSTVSELHYSIPQKKWAGEDSNLRRHEPSDLQSDAFDRFATCPATLLNNGSASRSELNFSPVFKRAGYRTRTDDLLITNQLLYQLSYASIQTLEA